jgi:putative methionine-R-sulfoxide reductase with GAF domain
MILDLSEEGLSMQMGTHLAGYVDDAIGIERRLPARMELELSEPCVQLETTGYIAWADALGRAGVRFADLPAEARERLNEWLTINAGAPSHIAPKIAVGRAWSLDATAKPDSGKSSANSEHMAVSLEAEPELGGNGNGDSAATQASAAGSATVQYEFNSLGTDLTSTLRRIAERARTLTRGSSAAIALAHKGSVMCRASVGANAPALGTRLDVNSGLSGECIREATTVRCDDAEHDPRVDAESCRRLGVRSILAAPVRYERDTVGLLMVFATEPFNFDEGDVAVVESLAHTVVRSMRQAETVGQR